METDYKFENILDIINLASKYKGNRKRSRDKYDHEPYNRDLEKLVDTSDEWIQTRTGIKRRHIATEDQKTSDLATLAVSQALNYKINRCMESQTI